MIVPPVWWLLAYRVFAVQAVPISLFFCFSLIAIKLIFILLRSLKLFNIIFHIISYWLYSQITFLRL